MFSDSHLFPFPRTTMSAEQIRDDMTGRGGVFVRFKWDSVSEMVLRIIYDMRNTGKKRSKWCRAQNEDCAGSRSIASFNKDLRDQSFSICSHGYFTEHRDMIVTLCDSHEFLLCSVQFSSVTTPFLSLSHSSWTTVLGLFVFF